MIVFSLLWSKQTSLPIWIWITTHKASIVYLHRSTAFKRMLCSFACSTEGQTCVCGLKVTLKAKRVILIFQTTPDESKLDILDTVVCSWTSVWAVIFNWSLDSSFLKTWHSVLWHDNRVASTSLNTCFDTFLAVLMPSKYWWISVTALSWGVAMQNVYL